MTFNRFKKNGAGSGSGSGSPAVKNENEFKRFAFQEFIAHHVAGSGGDIRVALYLSLVAKNDSKVSQSIQEIADTLGIAYATARLSIERLVEAGIIKRLSVGSNASYQLTSAKELSQCWSVDEFRNVGRDMADEMIDKAESSGSIELRFLAHRSLDEPKGCQECRKVYRTELERHLGMAVAEDELDEWIDAGAFVHAFGSGRCDVHLGMIRDEYAAVLADMSKSGNTKQWMVANWFTNLAKLENAGAIKLDEIRVSKVKTIDLAELVQSPHVKRRLKNGDSAFPSN